MDCFFEFFHVEILGAIVVRDLKLAAKTHDSSSSTSGKFLTEDFHELSLSVVHRWLFGLSLCAATSTAATSRSSKTTWFLAGCFAGIVSTPALLGHF